MNYRFSILSIGLLAFVFGCTSEIETAYPSRVYTMSGGFEGSDTRVSLEQSPSSLDMIAKWQEDDEMKVLIFGKNKYLELPAIPLSHISEDGKDCRFSFTIPEDYEIPESGYRLVCYTIPPGTDYLKEPKVETESPTMVLPLMRYPLDKFRAPVLYDGQVAKNDAILVFRHLYTYEILHVENNTDGQVLFSLSGFNAPSWWYSFSATLDLSGGGSSNGSGTGSWAPPRNKTKQEYEEKRESPVRLINPHSELIIISAYVPTGSKISNAQMVAKIEGETVYSSNTLSSDVELQIGHAYHMYAVWDGKELLFDKPFGAGNSEVNGGGTGYGSDGSGNISGSGLGYGSDSSGNIVGGGSGYGADGSGNLSGGGSGYTNAN